MDFWSKFRRANGAVPFEALGMLEDLGKLNKRLDELTQQWETERSLLTAALEAARGQIKQLSADLTAARARIAELTRLARG